MVSSLPHTASCLLICLSLPVCLGCVWPCPSLPLQEVVSRLIESRLRSLEPNTCSEELHFNCSSHTLLLTGLLICTRKPNTRRVSSDLRPLPCSPSCPCLSHLAVPGAVVGGVCDHPCVSHCRQVKPRCEKRVGHFQISVQLAG